MRSGGAGWGETESPRRDGAMAAARRRSFLSGRFPVHITGLQAPTCSNFLPLKFTLLPEKLKEQGFETHMASPLARRVSPAAFHLLSGAGGKGSPGLHDHRPPSGQPRLRYARRLCVSTPHLPSPPSRGRGRAGPLTSDSFWPRRPGRRRGLSLGQPSVRHASALPGHSPQLPEGYVAEPRARRLRRRRDLLSVPTAHNRPSAGLTSPPAGRLDELLH